MATVDCDPSQREEFDDDDGDTTFRSGPRIADAAFSDAARAAAEVGGSAQQPRRSRCLHRIAEVRNRQGVTLRNVARRLGLSLPVVRRQEASDCDLRISDLHRWQEVLDVPVAELLVEGDGQLSGPILERSRMVKLMKTAAALRERTAGSPARLLVDMLIDQILEIMPELADVTPWHTVGQRRTLDDLGRTARATVPDEVFRRGQP